MYGGTLWGMREHCSNMKRAIEIESKWEIVGRLIEGRRGVKRDACIRAYFQNE